MRLTYNFVLCHESYILDWKPWSTTPKGLFWSKSSTDALTPWLKLDGERENLRNPYGP